MKMEAVKTLNLFESAFILFLGFYCMDLCILYILLNFILFLLKNIKHQ